MKKKRIRRLISGILCGTLLFGIPSVSASASVTAAQALQIYNAELSQASIPWGESPVNSSEVRFAPVDLDGDGILELFVNAGNYKQQNGTFYEIWSIQNDSLYKSNNFPYYADPYLYSGKHSIVLSYGIRKGYDIWEYWKYSVGELNPYLSSMTERDSGTEYYYDQDGNAISSSDYYISLATLVDAAANSTYVEEFYDNTERNRQLYLTSSDPGTSVTTEQTSSAFYGIWVFASKTASDCDSVITDLRNKGYSARMYETTDWSNLNTEHWYVVSAGEYSSNDAANAALSGVQSSGYSSAYVKYTGSRK